MGGDRRTSEDLGVDYSVDEKEVGKVLERIEKREALIWMTTSVKRVYSAAGNGVLVITGGPGTGKAATINAIIKYLEYEGWRCVWRRRREEQPNMCQKPQDRKAQTIHRIWNYQADRMTTACEHSLSAQSGQSQTDVVIIDEMSIVDIYQ